MLLVVGYTTDGGHYGNPSAREDDIFGTYHMIALFSNLLAIIRLLKSCLYIYLNLQNCNFNGFEVQGELHYH
jgi:hypothetical protein